MQVSFYHRYNTFFITAKRKSVQFTFLGSYYLTDPSPNQKIFFPFWMSYHPTWSNPFSQLWCWLLQWCFHAAKLCSHPQIESTSSAMLIAGNVNCRNIHKFDYRTLLNFAQMCILLTTALYYITLRLKRLQHKKEIQTLKAYETMKQFYPVIDYT